MPQNKKKFEKSGGFQNFLNRPDRSGLDPVDTYRTQASIEGYFLRRLFTLSLRTRNIFLLIVMLLFGLAATGYMGFAFYAEVLTLFSGKLTFLILLAFALYYAIIGSVFFIGVALLINFVINIRILLGLSKNKSENEQVRKPKETKKKLPKRQKDYR